MNNEPVYGVPGTECSVCSRFTKVFVLYNGQIRKWQSRGDTPGTCKGCSDEDAARLLTQLKCGRQYSVIIAHHNPLDIIHACFKAIASDLSVDTNDMEVYT
ncbi:MAG: hypothetical protein VW879_13840, partial [Opitutae bacterium]